MVWCSCVTGRPGDDSGGAEGWVVCVYVCVCMRRRWLAGEGAELIAATGPSRYGVVVKMTSSCSIVTSLPLHLLSSSHSLHSFTLSPSTSLSTTAVLCK